MFHFGVFRSTMFAPTVARGMVFGLLGVCIGLLWVLSLCLMGVVYVFYFWQLVEKSA